MQKMDCDVQNLIDSVILNEDVLNIWREVLSGGDTYKDHPLHDIVEHQKEIFIKEKMNPKEEGFVVGAPWNGNLLSAKILFLGSNPGFTPGAINYRRMDDGTFCLNGKPVCVDAVRDSFTEAFEKAALTKKGYITVQLANGKNKRGGVPYWRGVRKFVKNFFGYVPRSGEDAGEYTKRLMADALVMEVVPFASQSEDLLTDCLLKYCWENFSEKIIARSDARVVLLVGGKARRTFAKLIYDDKQDQEKAIHLLENGGIIDYDFAKAGRPRKVTSVSHFSYWGHPKNMGPDGLFSPANSNNLQTLRNEYI
jgi:hypothetical protein